MQNKSIYKSIYLSNPQSLQSYHTHHSAGKEKRFNELYINNKHAPLETHGVSLTILTNLVKGPHKSHPSEVFFNSAKHTY